MCLNSAPEGGNKPHCEEEEEEEEKEERKGGSEGAHCMQPHKLQPQQTEKLTVLTL